jgi:hypothetical protein
MRRCRREQWRIGSLKQAGFHATGHWQVPREELKRLLEQVKRVSVDLPLIQELWLFANVGSAGDTLVSPCSLAAVFFRPPLAPPPPSP